MGVPHDDAGYTWVFPQWWSASNPFQGNPLADAALIAHEEYHHAGNWDEFEAYALQDECRTWQA